jgi:hypothetical protein
MVVIKMGIDQKEQDKLVKTLLKWKNNIDIRY